MGPAYKKITALVMLMLFSLTSVLGFFALAQPAQAQLVTAVAADVPRTVETVLDKVLKGLKIGVLNVASGAVSYALQKIAYDSAVWIASGGKGQSALIFSKGFGGYLSDVGNDALGKGIDKLSKAFGTNFCKIGDPNIDLKIRQSLRLGIGVTTVNDPTSKPNCTATQFFQNNLSETAWKSRFDRTSKSIQNQFNEMLNFSADQSNLGIQLASLDALSSAVNNAKATALQERSAAGPNDTKPLTTKISGDHLLPAGSVGVQLNSFSPAENVKASAAQINTVFSTGEFQLLPGALATFFLNTLAGTVIKNFQEKGILPFGACIGGAGGDVCQGSDTANNYAALTQAGGRRAAEALFSDFLAVRTAEVDQFNILGELSNCPDTPGVYNCRADSGFAQALQQAGNGAPLTLKEAVDKGLIRGDWKLLPPIRVAENSNKNCFQNAFCYSNIKALRQLRMVPLGFELAAEQSDPDKPWTLSEVLNGFNDCTFAKDATGKITGIIYDPINKPFCHLVDPNWVLKAPATRCNALVYGATLLSPEAPNRNQECADLSTCVAYNKDGSCVNYAYCTRESNSWNFAASRCSSQFRTCKAFTDESGSSKAYVYRSLDTGFCSQTNVGCQAYSLNQDANGNWTSPSGPTAYGSNSGAFFNATVSKQCGAQSAGCSAFQVAANPTVNLYLKQAPDYLKCYDANPATAQTERPQSVADLSALRPRTECANYAAACIADEVGCTYFTPAQTTAGIARVPAKFSSQDVCDARCVGYAAYRELPSNYSVGTDLAYVIPSSGKACTVQEEGCSGFTNLSTTAGGLEKVEYFSYVRTCSLPDPLKQKNFFTYEGSVSGFQLKTFTLVKDASGGPEYFARTDAERAQYDSICNLNLYKAGLASLDCREFNDEAGNTYYRLLSKTIPISESCTPYRLNTTELYPAPNLDASQCAAKKGYFANGACQVCLQGGEYRDGSCFYFGLPGGVPNTAGTSNVCSQTVDSCRAYKGNAGNNIRAVFADTFEVQGIINGWSGTGINTSPESVRVGGKSLNFSGQEAYRSFTTVPGHAYEVEFWAKGTGQALSVVLRSADGQMVKDFGIVTAGDAWRTYKLNSLELPTSASTTAQLVFKNPAGGAVYLDNVVLREVTQMTYLVKNSLKVDPVCDSNQNDNLPGEALGCSAYSDAAGNKLNLTGFSYLCREGAIGCTALLDTKNTSGQPSPRLHNLFLTGTGGTIVTLTVGTTTASCQIAAGESGCYADMIGRTLDEVRTVKPTAVVPSTVYVAPTTPSTSPVYLVASQSATCNAVDLGCTYAGLQTPSPTGPTYQTVLVKNNPAAYQQNLCQEEAIGCKAYTSASGPIYFKDPALTGNKICSYRTDVLVNGVKRSGWFWKNVGICSNNASQVCTGNTDCGATGATCNDIGNQPCYPTYQIDNSSFGLWSYGDKGKYENFVGECPIEQDSCTEFVDHADSNHPYYLIKDDKITQGTCDGKVSQKEGCALFDQTDNPNKFYATNQSYAASDAQQSKLVQPVLADANNPGDSNVIISVTRDRQCGEWLQCRSAHRVWDEKNARWKSVCDAVGRCNKAPENAEEDNISNCANWIEDDPINPSAPLTPETYVSRDIGWSGEDYSGMSVPKAFPLEDLSQVEVVSSPTVSDWRLVHKIACGDTNCAPGATSFDELCQTSGAACGLRGSGLCLNGVCVQNIDGTTKDLLKVAPNQSCRAYPEKDSPFPNSPTIQKAIRQFAGANVCNETSKNSSDPKLANACECDYTKVKYGDVLNKYFNYAAPNTTDEAVIPGSNHSVPAGICLGGSHDGAACSSDTECYQLKADGTAADDGNGNRITDGSCQKVKQKFQLVGWRGFCLEYDLSRTINGDANQHPCLTWYPVDYLTGTQDINNQYVDAGYRPPSETGGIGGSYFCSQGNAAGGGQSTAAFDYPQSRYFRSRQIKLQGNDFSRAFIPAEGTETKLTKMDIERIELNVVDSDAEDPKPGATFMIWPNATPDVAAYNKPQVVYTTNNSNLGPGTAVTGHYLGQPNDYILFYGSKIANDADFNYVNKSGDVCYPGATYGNQPGNVYPNSNACQDLGGNVFAAQGLSSRTGGNKANCSINCTNWDNSTKINLSATEGIWDTNPSVSDSNLCFSYGPRDGHAGHDEGNWQAVRLKFDANGKFLGYYVAYCDHSQNSGFTTYNVRFVLKQWCPLVADVTSNPFVANDNAAPWTNRLWKENKTTYTIPTLNYTYATSTAPYGSLAMTSVFSQINQQVNLTLFSPIPDCKSSGVTGCEIANGIKPSPSNVYQSSVAGAPYSCPDGNCVRTKDDGTEEFSNASGKNAPQGDSFLGSLFARVHKFYQYFGGEYAHLTQKGLNVFTPDLTETANGVRPPMVLSVGPCSDDGKCLENTTSTGISVNDSSKGDVKVFTPSARMFVRFFAFADANQMPLRRMEIDWGDGRTYPLEGLFRNARGYTQPSCVAGRCQVQQINDLSSCVSDASCSSGKCILQEPGASIGKCVNTQQLNACVNDQDCNPVPTCVEKNSAPTFGTITDLTCDNNYNQFEHVYQCARVPYEQGGNFHASAADCGDQRAFPNGCCIFVPKVRVTDNWGWCNGNCPSGPGGNGCYDASANGGLNECSLTTGSWTSYAGRIVVAPPSRLR